jgi:DNA-binding protein H-NS
MDERKRDSMIAYLRRRMAQVGIKVSDLAAAVAEDRRRQKSVRYGSATGETWNGSGDQPQWLKQAMSAGQSLEHFAISAKPAPTDRGHPDIDWRKDPFAGTRLATVHASSSHAR